PSNQIYRFASNCGLRRTDGGLLPRARNPHSSIRTGCAMRLERLEINGFKSFSDRSELAFDKGVTAIVGPNGCGKSNVADAITWVMGEQSAKSLRGDKMEDVIFSGSDARKPTAAAEVRLRFSGFLKTVSGPAFEAAANGNGHHHAGNGSGNGNGHHADASAAHHAAPVADGFTSGGALTRPG